MSLDSSEERFQKRTLRGKLLRHLKDDTEDLRREAQALESNFTHADETEDSTSPRSETSEASGGRKEKNGTNLSNSSVSVSPSPSDTRASPRKSVSALHTQPKSVEIHRRHPRVESDIPKKRSNSTPKKASSSVQPSDAISEATKTSQRSVSSPKRAAKPAANPFGTLRSKRRRNVRLLAEIDGESDAGAQKKDGDGEAIRKKKRRLNSDGSAKRTSKRTSSERDGASKGVKSSGHVKAASLSAQAPSSPSKKILDSPAPQAPQPSQTHENTGNGNVQTRLVHLELNEARAKQRELEDRLAKLTTEKKAKESQLALALSRISELERAGSLNSPTRGQELETTQLTARNLQSSINEVKREAINLEKLKIAMQGELRTKLEPHPGMALNEDLSDSTTYESFSSSSDDEEIKTNPNGTEGSLDFNSLEDSAIQVQRALAERKSRAKLIASPRSRSVKKTKTPSKAKEDGLEGKDLASGISALSLSSSSTSSISPSPSSLKQSTKKKRSSSGQGARTKNLATSTPSMEPQHDAATWFKTYYLSACQQAGVKPIEDLVIVLDRAISKARKLMELDLNGYSLGISDVMCLTKAFEATKQDIEKVSPTFLASLQALRIANHGSTLDTDTTRSNSRGALKEGLEAKESKQLSNSFLPIAVDLSHNDIPSSAVIFDLVKAAGAVAALDIGFNGMGPKGAAEFIPLIDPSLGVSKAERKASKTSLDGKGSSGSPSSISSQSLQNPFAVLVTFKCSDNMLGSKTGGLLISALAATCKHLNILDLSNNGLDDKAAVPLSVLISSCPLTTLIIKYNKFKTSGMKKISASLGQNPSLTELDLTQCGISEKSKEIVDILEERENIRKLCIGFNKLPSSFVPRFTSFTAKQKKLVHLDLRGLDLSSKAIRQVLEAISVNVSNTLEELVLNGNALDGKCLEVLIDYLTRYNALHSLGLRGCGLPKRPLLELLATVKHSSSLKSIDLSANNLNDRRILESLCSCIQNNSSLTVLGLAACKFDAKHSGVIAQALQFNKYIEKLHIDGNKLGERGLSEFALGVAGNDILKVVSIRATQISARSLISFVAAITAKTQVEVIDAGDNGLPLGNKSFRDRIEQFDAVVVKF